jgi:hypothetical protein
MREATAPTESNQPVRYFAPTLPFRVSGPFKELEVDLATVTLAMLAGNAEVRLPLS